MTRASSRPQKYSSAIKTEAICQNVGLMGVRVADTRVTTRGRLERRDASTDGKLGKNLRRVEKGWIDGKRQKGRVCEEEEEEEEARRISSCKVGCKLLARTLVIITRSNPLTSTLLPTRVPPFPFPYFSLPFPYACVVSTL